MQARLFYLDFRDLGPGEDSRSGLIRLRNEQREREISNKALPKMRVNTHPI